MINDENYKKLTDAVKSNMFSAKDLNLDETVIAAIKNSDVSMESFKIRQGIVDALNGGRMFKGAHWTAAKLDKEDEELASKFGQLEPMFDELIRIHHRERLKKMSEQAVERFHKAMASLPNSMVLPVTMEIDGVKKKVGDALIDPTEKGFCIMHAIIDGQENVAALLKADLSQISIGNKEDFKK